MIICTGYEYSFPFLSTACREDGLHLTWSEKHVQPLYKQLFHAQRPELAFVGLPWSVVPFPMFEVQAKLLAAVYSGKVQLPSLTGELSSSPQTIAFKCVCVRLLV